MLTIAGLEQVAFEKNDKMIKEGTTSFGGGAGVQRLSTQKSMTQKDDQARLIFVEPRGNKTDFVDNVAPYEILNMTDKTFLVTSIPKMNMDKKGMQKIRKKFRQLILPDSEDKVVENVAEKVQKHKVSPGRSADFNIDLCEYLKTGNPLDFLVNIQF